MAFMRMLWADSTPVVISSWDFWSSASSVLFTVGNQQVRKVNNKIAYYGIFKYKSGRTFVYYITLLSPDMDAVEFNYDGYYIHARNNPITDAEGNNWYYSVYQAQSDVFNNELIISDTVFTTWDAAALFLTTRIYSIPLHENYVAGVGNVYTLNYTDKNLVFRKIVGTYLHKRIDEYDTNALYKAISDNYLSLINNLNTAAYNSTFVHVHFNASDPETLYVYHAYISNFMSGECVGDWSYVGYPCYSFDVINSLPNSIDRLRVTYNTSQGSLYYTSDAITDKTMLPYTQGYTDVGLDVGSYGDLTMSNVGIEL